MIVKKTFNPESNAVFTIVRQGNRRCNVSILKAHDYGMRVVKHLDDYDSIKIFPELSLSERMNIVFKSGIALGTSSYGHVQGDLINALETVNSCLDVLSEKCPETHEYFSKRHGKPVLLFHKLIFFWYVQFSDKMKEHWKLEPGSTVYSVLWMYRIAQGNKYNAQAEVLRRRHMWYFSQGAISDVHDLLSHVVIAQDALTKALFERVQRHPEQFVKTASAPVPHQSSDEAARADDAMRMMHTTNDHLMIGIELCSKLLTLIRLFLAVHPAIEHKNAPTPQQSTNDLCENTELIEQPE